MILVLDASIVVDWALREGHRRAAVALAEVENGRALVPALWWFEVRNGLVVGERRRRISEQVSTEFLNELTGFDITVDRTPDEATIMTLARRHRLTVYDSAYLELALREGVTLATLDAALADAARREGVVVLD